MADTKEWQEHGGDDSDGVSPDTATRSLSSKDFDRSEEAVDSEQQQEKDFSTEHQQEKSSSQPTPPNPNGGYGWVCAVCVAIINMHTWGLNSSYGVFLAHYLSHQTFPGATRLDYAFIGGLSVSVAMLISPVATTTTRILGTHVTLAIGVVLEAGSLIAASFASQIWHLFLTQGVCFGLGMGFLFIGSVPIPSQWFTTRRSLANGISAAGSGIGGLVYSLATGAMLRTIGLAWAFRVLGIIAFVVNAICAALLRDRNKILGSAPLAFDTKILIRPEYLLLAAFGFLSMLGYIVLIFSLANYANAIGLDASQASIVSAIFNAGQALGRPPVGYFSDRVGRINMAAIATFLSGLFALVIWVFAKSYGVLIFYAIIGGMVAGTYWCVIAPVSAEVVGLKHVASALNLSWLIIVLPTLFSEVIALEIISGTGSYLGTILFAGFMYIAAAGCMLLLRGWKIGEREFLLARIDPDGDDDKEKLAALRAEDDNLEAKAAGRRTVLKYFWKWKKV